MSFKLAQILTQAGILSTDEMDTLFARHQEEADNGLSFDSLLSLEGHLSPYDAVVYIAQSLQLPPPDLDTVFSPDQAALDAIPPETVEEFQVFPWKLDDQLHLVAPLPFSTKLHKKLQASLKLPLAVLPIPQVFFAQLLERHFFLDPPEGLLPLIDQYPLPPLAKTASSAALESVALAPPSSSAPDLSSAPTLNVGAFEVTPIEIAPTLASPAFVPTSEPSDGQRTLDVVSFSEAFSDPLDLPSKAPSSPPSLAEEPEGLTSEAESSLESETTPPSDSEPSSLSEMAPLTLQSPAFPPAEGADVVASPSPLSEGRESIAHPTEISERYEAAARPTEVSIEPYKPLPSEVAASEEPEQAKEDTPARDAEPSPSTGGLSEDKGTLEFSSFVASASLPPPAASALVEEPVLPPASSEASDGPVIAEEGQTREAQGASETRPSSPSQAGRRGVVETASGAEETADETSCPSLSTHEIEVLLKRAKTANGALALGLCFFGGRLRHAGLFRSSKQTVKATQLLADEALRERIQGQEISLREPTIFQRIQDAIVPYVGPIPQSEVDQAFFSLFSPKPRFICVFPVRPFGRTVFILSGLRLKMPITPKHTEELMRCNALLAQALERFILAKKKGEEASSEAPEIQAILDSLMDHNVSALRQALRGFEDEIRALQAPKAAEEADELLIEEPEILAPSVGRSVPISPAVRPPAVEILAIRETPSLAQAIGVSLPSVVSEPASAAEPPASSPVSFEETRPIEAEPPGVSEPSESAGTMAAPSEEASQEPMDVASVTEGDLQRPPSRSGLIRAPERQIEETKELDLFQIPEHARAALLSGPIRIPTEASIPRQATLDLSSMVVDPSELGRLLGKTEEPSLQGESSSPLLGKTTEVSTFLEEPMPSAATTPSRYESSKPSDEATSLEDKTTFQDATLPLEIDKAGIGPSLDFLAPKKSIGVTGILNAFDPAFLGLPITSVIANLTSPNKATQAITPVRPAAPTPPPQPAISAVDLVAQIASEPNDLFAEFDAEPLGSLLPLVTKPATAEKTVSTASLNTASVSKTATSASKPVGTKAAANKPSTSDLLSSMSSGSSALSLDFGGGEFGDLLSLPGQASFSPGSESASASASSSDLSMPAPSSVSSTQLIDATASVSSENSEPSTAAVSEERLAEDKKDSVSPSSQGTSAPEPSSSSKTEPPAAPKTAGSSGMTLTKTGSSARLLVDLRVLLLQGDPLPMPLIPPPADSATLLLPMLLNSSARMREVALQSFQELQPEQVISSLLPLFETDLALDDIHDDGTLKPEAKGKPIEAVWSLLQSYDDALANLLPALLSSKNPTMQRLALLFLEVLPLPPATLPYLFSLALSEGPLQKACRDFFYARRKEEGLSAWLGWFVAHIAKTKSSLFSSLLKLLESLETPGIEGAFTSLLESPDSILRETAFRQVIKQIRETLEKKGSDGGLPPLEHPRDNLLSDDLFEPPILPPPDPQAESLLKKWPHATPPLREEILEIFKKLPIHRFLPTVMSFFPGKLERLDILPDGTLHAEKATTLDGILWNLLRSRLSEAPIYLLALLYHRQRHTRLMALLILTEKPIIPLIPYLFRLLLDLDPVISEQSRRLLLPLHKSLAYQEILEWLREKLEYSDPSQQVRVIRSLAILRDPISVLKLIELLKNEDEDKEVIQTAAHALLEITKQPLGDSYRKWSKWWSKTGMKSERVDWLLEALEQGESSLAEASNRELVEMTGRDFGFQSGAGKREKSAAIQQWRAWRKQNPIL